MHPSPTPLVFSLLAQQLPPGASFLGFFVVVGGLVGFLLWQQARANKKRRQSLRELADRLGLRFDPEAANPSVAEAVACFQTLEEAENHRSRNALIGSIEDVPIVAFDHNCVRRSEQRRRGERMSVVALKLEGVDLPAFKLRPETTADRLIDQFAAGAPIEPAWGPRIRFEDDPEFSQKWVLKAHLSPDERQAGEPDPQKVQAIRERFDEPTRDVFKQRGVSSEAQQGFMHWARQYIVQGEHLLLCQPIILPADQIERAIGEAWETLLVLDPGHGGSDR